MYPYNRAENAKLIVRIELIYLATHICRKKFTLFVHYINKKLPQKYDISEDREQLPANLSIRIERVENKNSKLYNVPNLT